MGVLIVKGEEAVLRVTLGRPIVTNVAFATRLFSKYFEDLFLFALGGVQNIVMNMSVFVCLAICLSAARITRKPRGQTSPILVHVACGRGSVL